MRTYIVLIAGGHASGKKTLAANLKTNLESLAQSPNDCPIKVELRSLDEFQKHSTDKQFIYSPKGYDFNEILSTLTTTNNTLLEPGPQSVINKVVILYGRYSLYNQQLRDQAIIRVFVDGDADVRLSRWLLRDTQGDSGKMEPILDDYVNYARPEMSQYISTTRQYADIILPQAAREYTDSSVNLLSLGIYDRIRDEVLQNSGYRPNVSLLGSPSLASVNGSPALSVREDSFEVLSSRYVELS